MGPSAGEGGLTPRLFLVAPELALAHLAACLDAACAAGDVASLLVPASASKELVALAQSKGVAVLTSGNAQHLGPDGIHVEAAAEAVSTARQSVGKDGIVGAYAGASRHFAMEAAEAGADYMALSQNGLGLGGEPIVKWWSEFFEIPCVAFDPVEAAELDTLLPQKPDFIRPADAMWDGPGAARRIVTELMRHLTA
jgi:thiamine-phosphate pyrophosphorylase